MSKRWRVCKFCGSGEKANYHLRSDGNFFILCKTCRDEVRKKGEMVMSLEMVGRIRRLMSKSVGIKEALFISKDKKRYVSFFNMLRNCCPEISMPRLRVCSKSERCMERNALEFKRSAGLCYVPVR